MAEHVARMPVTWSAYIWWGSFDRHMIDGGSVREDNIKQDRRCMGLV
jgi:hypothetical protein